MKIFTTLLTTATLLLASPTAKEIVQKSVRLYRRVFESDTTNQPENSIGPRTPNATTNNSESQKGSAQTHVVRAAITAEGMQVDERPKSDIHFHSNKEKRKYLKMVFT